MTKVSPLKAPTNDHQVRDIHTAKLHSALEKSQISSEQNSPAKQNELDITQNSFSHPPSKIRYRPPNEGKLKQPAMKMAESINPMMATADDIITQLIMTEDQSLVSSVATPFTVRRFSAALNGPHIIAPPEDHFQSMCTPQQMIHNQMRTSGQKFMKSRNSRKSSYA